MKGVKPGELGGRVNLRLGAIKKNGQNNLGISLQFARSSDGGVTKKGGQTTKCCGGLTMAMSRVGLRGSIRGQKRSQILGRVNWIDTSAERIISKAENAATLANRSNSVHTK